MIKQLLKKVRKEANGCWLWTGHIDKDGYGRVKYKRENHTAHHVVLLLVQGKPEEGLHALHNRECLHRHCVNPDHLHWGTNTDNSRERSLWGHKTYGEEFVEKVKEAVVAGEPQRSIAKRLGISQAQVSRIKNGRRSHHT